jgi:hypothetical protein
MDRNNDEKICNTLLCIGFATIFSYIPLIYAEHTIDLSPETDVFLVK